MTVYILTDYGNSSEGSAGLKISASKNYAWIFKTRKEAMQHRKNQHRNKDNARLSMPMKVYFYNWRNQCQ